MKIIQKIENQHIIYKESEAVYLTDLKIKKKKKNIDEALVFLMIEDAKKRIDGLQDSNFIKIIPVIQIDVNIVWKHYTQFHGLDYPRVVGEYKDYKFDIRYDYSGIQNQEPIGCGLWLTMYKNGNKIGVAKSSNIQYLIDFAEKYLRSQLIACL